MFQPGRRQRRKQISGIQRQPDASRCNGKRCAERELPDEEKRKQFSQFGPVDFFQITIRTARARHGRTQLSPHHAVAHGEHGAENPAQHGLRARHGADDQRNGNKRADADHVNHVQRSRTQKSDISLKFRLFRHDLMPWLCRYLSFPPSSALPFSAARRKGEPTASAEPARAVGEGAAALFWLRSP